MFKTALIISSIWTGSSTIDYQIHSNNDLLEWTQLMHKGARRYKVDPHYVEPKICAQVGLPSEDGCFLLNHDRPVVSMNPHYNSTDDLLSYLASWSAANTDKVTVALCFKDAPDLCNTTSSAFNSWLRLVDGFYTEATSLFNSSAIEFILDGHAKPIKCLVGRWPLWNSVWIKNDSPQDAYWSNAEEVSDAVICEQVIC